MEKAQLDKTDLMDSEDDTKLQAVQQVSDRDGDNATELNQIDSAVSADISRPIVPSRRSHDYLQPPFADAATQDKSSLDVTSSDGVHTRYLEDYIRHAYEDIQGFPELSSRIFSRSPGPDIQCDRDNRIIIYPGCFNPPHVGHAALLWHAYLNMDANTIAVMIFALRDDSLDSKDHITDDKGKAFILSHYQRRQLWKDDVLGRFAWVFPAHDTNKLDIFMATIKRLAKADGFKVSFQTLYGGDHISQKTMAEGRRGWDGRTCIGSDLTRPVNFVPEDGGDLLQLDGCDKWKRMKNEG
ncbi:hypothetical protein BKA58DRAFT_21586 [Alternaria rosae]|uniref:uncharacterized protein n=1 Tax=Alternaria rosae TaxID=1187941 RepID=UPI001E8E11C8|nr:uncharacterized protein BKA58DRAFT_21586 [Alternaria rosae]KAH6882567.1 hypothetical protein BKA58DRAFT_21586 [Alternaria rosae]